MAGVRLLLLHCNDRGDANSDLIASILVSEQTSIVERVTGFGLTFDPLHSSNPRRGLTHNNRVLLDLLLNSVDRGN